MLVYDSIKVPYRGSHHAEAYFSGSENTNKKTTFRNKKPRGSHGSVYEGIWVGVSSYIALSNFVISKRTSYPGATFLFVPPMRRSSNSTRQCVILIAHTKLDFWRGFMLPQGRAWANIVQLCENVFSSRLLTRHYSLFTDHGEKCSWLNPSLKNGGFNTVLTMLMAEKWKDNKTSSCSVHIETRFYLL